MTRITIIAAAVLLTLGGVAFAMSRPEVADPGPPVVLDSSSAGAATTPQAMTGTAHDADDDTDDAREDRDTKADRDDAEDEFQVATPHAVKADEDDWDDDGIELDDDGGADREED